MVGRIGPYTNFETLIDRVDAVEAASRYNDYATASENFSLTANGILAGEDAGRVGDPFAAIFETDPYEAIDAQANKPVQVG